MADSGFPEAFADALSRRGVSLAWLHHRLVERGHPVSPAALSYWRSGRSQPERGTSRDALTEIEHLLHVPTGELLSRLGPSRRPGPRPAEQTLRDLFAENPGMERALGELGFDGLYDELVEQVRHLVMDVDADGCVSRIQVRAVMQARRDGGRRTPLVMTLDEPRLDAPVRAGRRLRPRTLRRRRGVRGVRRRAAAGPRAGQGRDESLRARDRAGRAGRRDLGGPLRRPSADRAAGVGAVRPPTGADGGRALHRGCGGDEHREPLESRRRDECACPGPWLRPGRARPPLGPGEPTSGDFERRTTTVALCE